MTRSSILSFKTRAVALAALWLASVGVAFAWDGAVSGFVAAVEITGGTNFGFRVFVSGASTMCTGGGSNWAYLNETDSNFKTYVAALLAAKAQGSPVVIYSTLESGYCHIGYVSIQ